MIKISFVFLIYVILLVSTGCTLVGAIIGETTKTDEIIIELNGTDTLNINSMGIIEGGDSIYILKQNGSLVGGTYPTSNATSIIITTEELLPYSNGVYLPTLGDTIKIQGNENEFYEFLGFRQTSMRLKDSNGNIILMDLNQPKIFQKDDNLIFNEADLISISKDKIGETENIRFSEYKTIIENFNAHKYKLLEVDVKKNAVIIPFSEIESIRIPANDGDFWTFTIVGGVIDLGIITILYFDYKEHGIMGMNTFE